MPRFLVISRIRRSIEAAIPLATLGLAALAMVSARPVSAADYEPGQVLVRYRPGVSAGTRTALESALAARVLRSYALVPVRLLELGPGVQVEQAVARLRQDPSVAYAEPNYRIHAAAVPNDPQFPLQEALRNTGQTGGIPGADIHAVEAWDLTTGNPNLKVGVLDTGVDATHPDLLLSLWINPDEARGEGGQDDDVNGYTDDVYGYNFADDNGDVTDFSGHGTQMAGLIGATGNNGIGVTGVEWRASVVSLKVMRSNSDGSIANVLRGIQYCTDTGIRLALNAFVFDTFSQAMFDAIQAAGNQGMLFVSAAGNEGADLDVNPRYPASYDLPYILDVAATTASDSLAGFSNHGELSVDIAAPGVNLLTTQASQLYTTVSGTSAAAALVTGVCALAIARFPNLSVLEIRDLVLRSVDRQPQLVGRVGSGGRLNARATIADPDLVLPAQITDLTASQPGSSSMVLRWTAPGDDSTSGRAQRYEIRYSLAPITSGNFDAATPAPAPTPSVAGATDSTEILGLTPSTLYYFAVLAVDESQNLGPVSNVVTGTTLGPPRIAVSPARIGTALVAGGSGTETFRITNLGLGTLDFEIPSPQLQGLRHENPIESALPKDAPDGLPGPPVLDGAGGPDAYGYLWSDDAQANGPRFQWVDLVGRVPPIALTGDDAVSASIAMNLVFPLYGSRFDHVTIGTNGYLSFTAAAAVFDNHAFPTGSGPPNMVAPLWDDFDLGTAQRVYAAAVDGRFVVSWVGVARRGGGGSYTFEALLFPSGEIRFQYLTLGTVRNSGTAGIQNQNRTIGLTVVHNTDYLRDSLAIRIRPVSQWLTVEPASGRVPAGQSLDVEARFRAVDLPGGGLTATLQITSNDPVSPTTSLPVMLYVFEAPDVDVAPVALSLDTVIVGAPVLRTLTVANRGRLPLQVADIVSGDANLTATPRTFVVLANTSRSVTVRYEAHTAGTLATTLTLATGDPDEAHVVVPVTATTLLPPVIEVDPESLAVDLFTNEETTRTLELANRGGSALAFHAQVLYENNLAAVGGGALTGASRGDAAPRGAVAPVATPLRSGGPDQFGYRWTDSDSPDGPAFAWIDIRNVGTVVPMNGDDANSGPYAMSFSFPFYGNTYSSFRVCTNGFLSFTSAANALFNLPLPEATAPRNLIAPFWDDLSFNGVPSVLMHDDGDQMVIEYLNVTRFAETNPITFEVILHRDGSIVFQYLSVSTPHADSCTVGIQDASGQDGLGIAYNAPFVRSDFSVRITPPRQFLTVIPESGLLAAGNSLAAVVDLDASGLIEGVYRATIRLETDDVVRPIVDVPVRLSVRGAARAVVTPDTLSYGDVYIGYPRARTFDVANIGTARLEITAMVPGSPVYHVDPATLSLSPAQHATVRVSFDPTSRGGANTTLTLATNDPGRPIITLALLGQGLPAPGIRVSPDSLTAELATPLDPGRRVTTRTLKIENRGASDLTWHATPRLAARPIAGAPEALGGAPLAIQPAKGARDAGAPTTIASTGGPDGYGYKWTDSDEPGGPAFSWIDVSGTGTRVPFARDDQNSGPIALSFPFAFYGIEFDSVRICSNGWLSFSSRDTTYANVVLPNAGPRAPANLIAPFWDDLDLRQGGRVYYGGDANRFVVSFLDAPHWVQPGQFPPGVYTFQVVLHPTGDIDYQYLDMQGVVTSATVGIQNGTKDVGLTVAFNSGFVHDGLRVRLSRLLDWLKPLTTSGVVAPGDSELVTVRFDATGLVDGAYDGLLEITSNDPLDSVVTVVAHLTVGGPGSGAPSVIPAVGLPPAADAGDLPRKFALAFAGRHPVRDAATFELALPERRAVTISVYDVRGARVRRIEAGELAAGRHRMTWDTRDGAGRALEPGVFFVRATAGAWGATLRVALVR